MLAPKRPRLPMLASDGRPPPARAHGPVSDAAQKVAAENLTGLADTNRLDLDRVKHGTIVADPPWRYDDGFSSRSHTAGVPNGPARRYALPYPPLDVEAIAALPVGELAASDARVFLWTTNRYLPHAFTIVKAWGFAYKQTLAWVKRDGFSGSVAPNAEFLIVGTRGAPRLLGRWPSAVVSIARTRTHSRKPDAFLDLVERVSPGPYLELFARRQRLGWDTWGNEALEHVELSARV